MKLTIRLLSAVLAATLLFSGAVPASGAAENTDAASLRGELATDGRVRQLYSIDKYHTYLVSTGPVPDNAAADGFTLVRLSKEGPLVRSIIRHDTPQPIIYKSGALAPKGELQALPAGEIRLEASGLEAAYTGADLYQHAYSACVSTGGTPSFVVPRRHGRFKRLTRVSALKAFIYIVDSKRSTDGAWYIACYGEKKFVVEKKYSFMAGGEYIAEVAYRRGLEGVSYVDDVEGSKAPQRVSAPVEPSEAFLKEMAVEVGRLKGRLVKVKNGSRFSGSYTRPSAGEDCEKVSIRRTWDLPDVERSMVKVYDFKLCRNRVESLGERSGNATTRKSELAIFLGR